MRVGFCTAAEAPPPPATGLGSGRAPAEPALLLFAFAWGAGPPPLRALGAAAWERERGDNGVSSIGTGYARWPGRFRSVCRRVWKVEVGGERYFRALLEKNKPSHHRFSARTVGRSVECGGGVLSWRAYLTGLRLFLGSSPHDVRRGGSASPLRRGGRRGGGLRGGRRPRACRRRGSPRSWLLH